MKVCDKKSERLQLRLSPSTKKKLLVLAESCDLSMADYLDGLIAMAWRDQVKFRAFDINVDLDTTMDRILFI